MYFSGASLWWLCLVSTPKWAHGDSHGVAEYPELLSWLQHWLSAVTSLSCGPAVVAAALWDVQEMPRSQRCLVPAVSTLPEADFGTTLTGTALPCCPMPTSRWAASPSQATGVFRSLCISQWVFPLWCHGCDQGVPHRCAEQLLLGHCTSFYPCQKEKINSEHKLALVAESVFFCGC